MRNPEFHLKNENAFACIIRIEALAYVVKTRWVCGLQE